MRTRLASLLLLVYLGALTSVNAQSRVQLKPLGGTYSVENGLPVPIVALVVARDQDGQMLAATSVTVGANGAKSAGGLQGPVVRLEDWDVIDLRVPRWSLPTVSKRGLSQLSQTEPTRTKALLKRLEISESGEGTEKIALVPRHNRIRHAGGHDDPRQ